MLVVGLGNPGKRYAGSPHNVGFRVLESFAEERGQVAWTRRFQGEVALASVDQAELLLLKPLTYMNRSGESVREAMSFFQLSEADTLIVHDELDLPLGGLKLKRGGGEAGHNGLKSVSAALGTRDYFRLRVGVGRPRGGEVPDFLLTPLPDADLGKLETGIQAARAAIELVARQGVDRAMGSVNRRPALPGEGATGATAAKTTAADNTAEVLNADTTEAGRPD
jgi:PTH1 family peptidyl-tRNA hydrolase